MSVPLQPGPSGPAREDRIGTEEEDEYCFSERGPEKNGGMYLWAEHKKTLIPEGIGKQLRGTFCAGEPCRIKRFAAVHDSQN